MHCDISAGNILILPRLGKPVKGVQTVEWRGFLTDWELAKHMGEGSPNDTRNQPERTGTWQFMSVAYIASDWTQPIEVADELESFFHVMMYYAARLLRNSLPSVSSFVTEYFDTFHGGARGRLACSSLKIISMRHGGLEWFGMAPVFLKKSEARGNPLNDLIEALLTLIRGRYKCLAKEVKLEEEVEEDRGAARHGPAEVVGAPLDNGAMPLRFDPELEPWFINPDTASGTTPAPKPAEGPTVADLAAKAHLDSHAAVLTLFAQAAAKKTGWSDTDVVDSDQLVDYEPRIYIIGAADPTYGVGAKRRKTGHAFMPSFPGSPSNSISRLRIKPSRRDTA
ncbi:hypothetical protein C8Q78DRAFT_384221 [Trametes maxima]|nr:hypothetical protein C8Q78DRAFT_384221 [Trametes maxima]